MVLLWSNWAKAEQAVLFSSYYRHSIVRFKYFMFTKLVKSVQLENFTRKFWIFVKLLCANAYC